RDKSRDKQILHTIEKPEDNHFKEAENDKESFGALETSINEVNMTESILKKGRVSDCPNARHGVTVSIETPAGTCHVIMNNDENGDPFEVFVEVGKGGSDIKAMAEALGRLISMILRLPGNKKLLVKEVVSQLKYIGGASSVGFGKNRVRSLPDAVAKALQCHWLEESEERNVGHEN